MPLIVKREQGDYHAPPQALHPAVCCDVIDLGVETTDWGPKHKVKIVFQTEEVCPETKAPYTIGKKYTFSLGDKAALRRDLETWRNRKFTEQELVGYDLEKVLNANAQIQVIHQMGQKGTYAYIAAVMPPSKGQVPLKVAGYTRKQWNVNPVPAVQAGPVNDEEVPF